jgi:hypothetical protein
MSAASARAKLPKKFRAEWMDVMALDPRMPPVAYKVAGVIGAHFSRYTAETYIKHATIAEKTGLAERTVWGAIQLLIKLGYLMVERRELGFITRRLKDGTEVQVRLAGGRGVANIYRPAFERSHVSIPRQSRGP